LSELDFKELFNAKTGRGKDAKKNIVIIFSKTQKVMISVQFILKIFASLRFRAFALKNL